MKKQSLRMLRPRVALSHAKPLGKTIAQQRVRGSAGVKLRRQVLREEPICRVCLAADTLPILPSRDVDHIVPLFEGGSNDRSNLQGICDPHHKAKSTAEYARRLGAAQQASGGT